MSLSAIYSFLILLQLETLSKKACMDMYKFVTPYELNFQIQIQTNEKKENKIYQWYWRFRWQLVVGYHNINVVQFILVFNEIVRRFKKRWQNPFLKLHIDIYNLISNVFLQKRNRPLIRLFMTNYKRPNFTFSKIFKEHRTSRSQAAQPDLTTVRCSSDDLVIVGGISRIVW